jgi:hypothetical protein
MPDAATFSIDPCFNGPPGSANGGYACGRLASLAAGHIEGPVTVTLLAPVPLGTPLRYDGSGRRGQAWHGDELIATVSPAREGTDVPPPVAAGQAEAASRGFLGRSRHPFPTCFACGVDRAADGLRLSPGPVAGQAGTVACLWRPGPGAGGDGTAREVVWAALDCPGGWTADPAVEPRLLGRMSACILELPGPERAAVVVARRVGCNGRVALNASALYDAADGRLLASASAHWVAV